MGRIVMPKSALILQMTAIIMTELNTSSSAFQQRNLIKTLDHTKVSESDENRAFK